MPCSLRGNRWFLYVHGQPLTLGSMRALPRTASTFASSLSVCRDCMGSKPDGAPLLRSLLLAITEIPTVNHDARLAIHARETTFARRQTMG